MAEIVGLADQSIKLTKGQKRRAEILALARDQLIHEGYDHFILRTIAEQAHIKLGNLQYYFSTREDLLEAVGEQEFSRGLEIVRDAIELSGTPKDKLVHMVRRLVGDWQQTGGRVYAVIAMLALHQERFRRLHTSQYKVFYRSVAELLQTFNPTETHDASLRKARLVTTLMDGALFQVAPRGRGSHAERAEFHDDLIGLILSAVAR